MLIPEEERDLFLLVGHFANEIIVLSKLVAFSLEIPDDKITGRAALVQALFVNKMLVGKLYEGWNLLRRGYFGTALSRDYDALLSDDARAAVRQLNRYFRRGDNIFGRTRNRFASHYDPGPLNAVLNDMRDGDKFEIYLSDQNLNCLYYVSEAAVNIAMLHDPHADDLRQAFENMYAEIVEVHGWFLEFVPEFIAATVTRYFGDDFLRQNIEEGEIGDGPALEDVRLPFFVSTSSHHGS